jgi:hypothetical protein
VASKNRAALLPARASTFNTVYADDSGTHDLAGSLPQSQVTGLHQQITKFINNSPPNNKSHCLKSLSRDSKHLFLTLIISGTFHGEMPAVIGVKCRVFWKTSTTAIEHYRLAAGRVTSQTQPKAKRNQKVLWGCFSYFDLFPNRRRSHGTFRGSWNVHYQ